ncbi:MULTISPECIES: recombinase family protein [Acinetobacter]|jgi:DNA invertase Pin-like site-specific DNA recombinase|uniref:Resolvase/invertase-type recombinase catalytic domain-containing protein n=5 Tax=Gammaproteobacteria TaxID=1236 RepID=N9NT62_9GAMM|nr:MULTISPECIES: recombinase family protein [Acinetobacter]EHU1296390.1 recombinase family protein [Acinetobacter baumannii]EHU1535759.1 recombinase family protein [Acinetobacter baumannii]EHU1774379.1 recombinase family protein [Acinetobacter baumannii]EHU1978208.1 recombinase family protein [Acinetobacter baumannii]EHU2096744.1 recombinase family protein [Acinetobacter baumannii]
MIEMNTRIYLRASTKDQDAERALQILQDLNQNLNLGKTIVYVENYSGTKLDRPELNKLLSEANQGDTLLVESIDRLSRLTQQDFQELKRRIQEKGLRLIVADLPTTYQMIQTSDSITHSILELINNMLIDLLATMARLDNEKRIERIKQGLERSGYKPTGKKANEAKHKRIKELLAAGNMTKEEIAKAVNCGVATVYRVAKVI